MTTPTGHVSTREQRRNRVRRLRWARRMWRLATSLAVAAVTSGTLFAAFMYVAGSTAPVASAQARYHMEPYRLSSNGPVRFIQSTSAGKTALLVLHGTAHGLIQEIPQTRTTRAHEDAAIQIDATCSFSASGMLGDVIDISLSQTVTIDDQSRLIILDEPPKIGGSTNYFWQITTEQTAQISELPDHTGVTITGSAVITRFTKGGSPIESHQFELQLTIRGDGELACAVSDP